MAQIKRNFLKSKMNKDLDARLIPNGEYREARNINISKSEGSDVGALENIKGNSAIIQQFLAELQSAIPAFEKLDIIGLYADESTSSLYLFITSWTDNSITRLNSRFGGHNFIVKIFVNKDQYTPSILVKGSFLNFSKNSPIYNIDVLENRLYWTDNRNQPRKINISLASSTGIIGEEPKNASDYYYCEDQISVAKFAPYEAIKFVKNTGDAANPVFTPTWKSEEEEWLPISLTAPITSIISTALGFGLDGSNGKNGMTNPIGSYFTKSLANVYPSVKIKNADKPGTGEFYLAEVYAGGNDGARSIKVSTNKDNPTTAIDITSTEGISEWEVGDYVTFQLKNPEYKINENLDRRYLEDKFVRFSYRFKYDDDEYSLIAPFTQPLFISKQFNQFLFGNEAKAGVLGELSWFRNLITSAELIIQLPDNSFSGPVTPDINFLNRYKVKEIEILLKSSNDNNVYSIDTIELNTTSDLESFIVQNNYVSWPENSQLAYKYNGSKPFQVLPERDITRVSDATPVRAYTQEIAANRVMYGNYLNSHGAPKTLDYECFVGPKENQYSTSQNPPIPESDPTIIKEYYASTLKQGRTYQVGIILADRYGRQSNVILANNEADFGSVDRDKSTIYAPYDNVGLSAGVDNFWGNVIKINFENEIPSSLPSVPFYPGIYNSVTNPLGWYSYKVVVKQSEQEYYNVYLAGALSGNVIFKSKLSDLEYNRTFDVSNISLFGGNINKIPKNTSNISSTDKTFSSETFLYFRVAQTIFDETNIYNNITVPGNYNVQPIPVTNIQSFLDFAPWSKTKGGEKLVVNSTVTPVPSNYPNNFNTTLTTYIDPVYYADKNPFIATLDTTSMPDLRIGFEATTQKGVRSTSVPPRFSKFLNVAETNPFVSELDIYWETTTSGLITDLNEAIRTGEDSQAVGDVSPFLFTLEEQYPYDGTGIYVDSQQTIGPGAYILQQNLKGITNAGAVITDANLTMENLQVNFDPPLSTGGSPVFELVQVESAQVEGFNSFNLRLATVDDQTLTSFNPDLSFSLAGHDINITFDVKRPGFTPVQKSFTFTNNLITNNIPKWEYTNNGNASGFFGLPANQKPDPDDASNIRVNLPNFGSCETERLRYAINDDITLNFKKILNSPFIPTPDTKEYQDVVYSTMNAPFCARSEFKATSWSGIRNQFWTISVTGKDKIRMPSSSITNFNAIGKCFFKQDGTDKITNLNNSGFNQPFGPFMEDCNSATRFNYMMINASASSISEGANGTSNGYFSYSNGSFAQIGSSNILGGNDGGVKPYIKSVKLAVFHEDDFRAFNNALILSPSTPVSNNIQLPSGGFKDFVLVGSGQNTGGNGGSEPPSATINGKKVYGYPEWPFVIKRLQFDRFTYDHDRANQYMYFPSSAPYCLLADPRNPPFVQIGSTTNKNKFDATGGMSSKEICVYKIEVGLREIFTGGLISSETQNVYVKLIR